MGTSAWRAPHSDGKENQLPHPWYPALEILQCNISIPVPRPLRPRRASAPRPTRPPQAEPPVQRRDPIDSAQDEQNQRRARKGQADGFPVRADEAVEPERVDEGHTQEPRRHQEAVRNGEGLQRVGVMPLLGAGVRRRG